MTAAELPGDTSGPRAASGREVSLQTRLLQLLLLMVYIDSATGDSPGLALIGVGDIGELALLGLIVSLVRPDWVAQAEESLRGVSRRFDEFWIARGGSAAPAPRQRFLLVGCLVLLPLLVGSFGRLPGALVGWAVAVCWRLPDSAEDPRQAWRILWRATFALAVLVRVGLILGSPHPHFVPDSWTYVNYAEVYLFKGESFGFNPARTPITSLYYLAILAATRSYYAALLLTHAAGVLVPAYVSLRLRAYWGQFSSWLLFSGVTLSTMVIYYEHAVLSEHLTVLSSLWAAYQIVLWFATRDRPVWRGLALGAALALTILTRPQFLIWVPFVFLALVLARSGWRLLLGGLVAFLLPLLLWCSYNQATHGSFGLTSIGSDALFGSYGHLIDTEGEDLSPIQREMAPALQRHARLRPPWDPNLNWLIYSPEGPLNQSQSLQALSPGERARVIKALTLEAMRRKPLQVLRRFGYQIYRYHDGQALFVLPTGADLRRRHESYPHHEREPIERPIVRRIEGIPGGAALADALISPLNLLNRTTLILALQFPIWSLLFVVFAFRHKGRERLLLLVFASCSLSLIGVTCFLGVGTLPRYYIQLIVPNAFGVAVLARSWARRAQETDAQ